MQSGPPGPGRTAASPAEHSARLCRLAGSAIPLAARLVSVGDVYDALRSRRPYKPALSHAVARQLMTEASPGQFDPVLLKAISQCADHFEKIFRETPD